MNAFRAWLRGLISVAISSAASGIALVIADPMSFNLQAGLPKLASVCGVLALVHVGLYLQKSPLWADGDIQVNAPSASSVTVTTNKTGD